MFGDALADCERWRRSYGDSHFNLAMLAYIYGRSGRQVEARQALDKAYTQHSNHMTSLKVEPVWDSLRDDPRFKDLMRRVGLAP